jgi:branched-chain amino acid transport system substrate-binding protein
MSKSGRVFLLVSIVVVTLMVAGCPKKQSIVTDVLEQPEMPGPTGEPIKIGAIFSVTGHSAPLGEPEKMTAEMLADQINEQGGLLGRPVQVIVKDDKSVPDEAVLAAKDLINNEKVVAILGSSSTPNTLAIVDICQEAQIPLVSCAAGAPITNPVKEWVFAVPQTDAIAVEKVVDYLKTKGITKVATIYVSNAYGESGQEQLVKQLPAAGIEIITSETFGADDTDMTAQVTKIAGKNPEAVICWGTNPGPATVAKNMHTLGLTIPLLQSHGVANAKFFELAGEGGNGVMLPAGRLIVRNEIPDDDPQKSVLDQYASAYEAKYSRPVDTFGGHAYDSLMIVVGAIEAAGATEPQAVRDAIEKTKDFVGTAGVFTYSPQDHNGLTKNAFVWVKIVDGKWKLAEDELAPGS